MQITHIWAITSKEMNLFGRKKNLLYSTFVLPLMLSIGLPLVIMFVKNRRQVDIQTLLPVINAFSFIFLILAVILPATIASYSFVGEKVQKTLEPLLATPTTDSEILVGKFLTAFFPCIVALYVGARIFMVFINSLALPDLGSPLFPNQTFSLILFLCVPLAMIYSVELCVIISSRSNDIRSTQQLSYLTLIPFLALYIMIEIRIISLETNTLLIIAGIFLLLDITLFFISRVLFQREEILTKWK